MVVIGLLFVLIVPYTYYAVQINIYGHSNAPPGYHFPSILADGWLVVLSGALNHLVRVAVMRVTLPLFRPYVRGDDE